MARLIAPETRQRLQDTDPRWRSKAVMRMVATFFAFIAMILFAVSVAKTLHWEDVWNGGAGGDWTDGMALAPVLISLLYNPITLLLLFRLRNGRAYHPGWDVGFDLIIWALSVPSVIFSVGDGWFWWWQPVILEFEPNDFVPCRNPYNFWSQPCQPDIYVIGKIEIAANVFLALILIIHFTLFVIACIATHKWRRQAKKANTERRNIELQYHRSPEEHKTQQPQAPLHPYPKADFDKHFEAHNGTAASRDPGMDRHQVGGMDKDIEAGGGTGAVQYA